MNPSLAEKAKNRNAYMRKQVREINMPLRASKLLVVKTKIGNESGRLNFTATSKEIK